MRKRLLSSALFLLLPLAAFSQGFTVEQVMSAPFAANLAAAKRAPAIAWTFNIKGATNVWTAAAPDFAGRQLTQYNDDDGQPIASVRLTPDGKTVLYTRGTEVNEAGHSANPLSLTTPPKQQVWAVEVAGGAPRLIGDMGCSFEGCEDIEISPDGQWAVWSTKHQLWIAPVNGGNGKARQLTDVQGDAAEPQWSPEGKRIAFRVNRRTHALIAIGDLDMAAIGRAPQTGDSEKSQPALLSAVHYVAPTVDRDTAPQWSPDGRQIVFLRTPGQENKLPLIPVRPEPWSIWLGDASNYTARQLWKSGSGPRDSVPEFAEESLKFAGDRIVFASEQTNRNHLYSIAVTGGSAKELTPGDFDVEDVTLAPDGHTIVFSSNQNDVDRRHIWRVDAAGSAPQQALTRGETIEWAPVVSGDGATVLCLGSGATSPGMAYRIASGGRQPLAQNAIPPEFPAAQLIVPKQVIFRSSDGLEIHGQLFLPHDQTPHAGPALIFTHGGPPRQMMLGFHYMAYYANAYAENEYLASHGYTVLSVNYRLGIMYGHDFRRPPNSGWRGASEYNDVLAGAKYLQSLPNVDPQRIGLWGGSYGGFLTAMGLARNSDMFKAGVDFHGVHDWSMFLPRWEDGVSAAPDAKDAIQLAWQSSPDSSIEKWRSPVLLIHGDDDRNVAFNQTTDLVQRLKKQGVEFEEIVYPDEIHDLLLWRDWVHSYKAGADFFDRHLGIRIVQ